MWNEIRRCDIAIDYFLLIRYQMKSMKGLVIIGVLLIAQNSFGQNPKFDRLEMLFAQRHYKRVYRKSNRLLDKPEYDFSMLPTYYKAMSLFQLAQNHYWRRRHSNALDEAKDLFLAVKKSENGERIFNAHMYELAWVREDLMSWASDLKRMGYHDEFQKVQEAIAQIFGEMPEADLPIDVVSTEIVIESIDASGTDERSLVVQSAQQYLGVPYVWAGATPKGFDCSGFTSYILAERGKQLSRRSADQFDAAKKVRRKDVKKGDLVFFSNGSGVSHVGIVVSEQGESLKMIHSSSSKGIIITEVVSSEYWSKRLHGFGTYLD